MADTHYQGPMTLERPVLSYREPSYPGYLKRGDPVPPAHDLDLETLDLLQELLADYPGTALIVSHDRDFLDRVATSIIVSEENGLWREYAGGYTDMLSVYEDFN